MEGDFGDVSPDRVREKRRGKSTSFLVLLESNEVDLFHGSWLMGGVCMSQPLTFMAVVL